MYIFVIVARLLVGKEGVVQIIIDVGRMDLSARILQNSGFLDCHRCVVRDLRPYLWEVNN